MTVPRVSLRLVEQDPVGAVHPRIASYEHETLFLEGKGRSLSLTAE